MKCDKCKQTGRHKAMQVGTCKICQECVDASASVKVEESTDRVNMHMKLRVNELLAYVSVYTSVIKAENSNRLYAILCRSRCT